MSNLHIDEQKCQNSRKKLLATTQPTVAALITWITQKKRTKTQKPKKKKTEAINEQNLKDQNENQTNVWGNVDNKCVCKCFYG